MLEHFWNVRRKIISGEIDFEYSDYGGLPKRISNKLPSEMVDVIQEEIVNWIELSQTKKQFMKIAAEHLSRGLIQ